jgi:hypothetical protein
MPDLNLDSVLAEAHSLALENEREIVRQTAPREKEISDIYTQIAKLGEIVSIQTVNVNNLVATSKETQNNVADIKNLLVSSCERLGIVETFMIEEKKLHEKEELEKKEALKVILVDKKEDAKEIKQDLIRKEEPKIKLFYGILQQLIWLALLGLLGWFGYLITLLQK